MADLVFAFDPALDRPLPRLESAPPQFAETVATAAQRAFGAAVAVARETDAAALVLFGRILDPHRASPAQAAAVREAIVGLAQRGCRTIWLAGDGGAADDAARMLGEPVGLHFVTPTAPLRVAIRSMDVEILARPDPRVGEAAAVSPPAASERRIVLGWDTDHWDLDRWAGASLDEPSAGGPHAGLMPPHFALWGSRGRPVVAGGMHHLPAIQARSCHEAAPGCCGVLSLLDHPAVDDDGSVLGSRRDVLASRTDWRHHWREVPTHQVSWRTIRVASATGGDEELAAAIWSALEPLAGETNDAMEIIRCLVECGTSVPRRVRVAELSAETLARVRNLAATRNFRGWCREILGDPGESLAALGHSRSGGKPGSTTSFSTALADIVTDLEQHPHRGVPPELARESAWLALELLESS